MTPRTERRPAVRAARAGQKVTLTFRAMDPDGSAVGTVGTSRVAVPFAIPGEEALVEIIRGGGRATGKIVTLLQKSPQTAAPRCRHFGVCGGCQWQHLTYDAQLEHKAKLVRQALAPMLGDVRVRDPLGGPAWEYRNRLQATFAVRQDRVVAGYYAAGDERRIVNVRECPIQHPENVRALAAGRDVIAALDWPIYDPASRRGLVRGLLAQTACATGETMVVLSVTREIPDRMAFVRAMRERVSSLVSLLLSVQPSAGPGLLGRISLLWGRNYLEEEIGAIRLRLYPAAAIPPNPRALSGWLEAITARLNLDRAEVVVDTACEEGLLALALAPRAGRVIGIAPDREAMHRAWENARLNGIENCVFYTRAPAGVLAKRRARGERIDAAVVTARGGRSSPEVFTALAAAGARRLVCTGSTLTLLAADLRAAREVGFRIVDVQPVDLLPQTSRVHAVVQLER